MVYQHSAVGIAFAYKAKGSAIVHKIFETNSSFHMK